MEDVAKSFQKRIDEAQKLPEKKAPLPLKAAIHKMEADKRKMDQAAARLVQLRKKIVGAETAVTETSQQYARSEFECKQLAGAGEARPAISEPGQLAALLPAPARCTD